MLPDQEVEIVERVIGEGRHVRNLQYIHRQCAYDSFFHSDELGEHINLFSMLDGINSEAPVENTPYMELTEYFRLCKKAAFSLTFKQIETILGDTLCWEAYHFEAFWFDDEPGMNSPMWQEEGYAFQVFIPSKRDYCICDSWISQGYEIKALYLKEKRAVFHRVNNNICAFTIPKALTAKKIPNEAVFAISLTEVYNKGNDFIRLKKEVAMRKIAKVVGEQKATGKPGRRPMTLEEKAVAARLRAAEKERAENLRPDLILQYQGTEVNMEALVDAAKADFHGHKKRTLVTDLKLYIKPEEHMAYYVINETYEGKIPI